VDMSLRLSADVLAVGRYQHDLSQLEDSGNWKRRNP